MTVQEQPPPPSPFGPGTSGDGVRRPTSRQQRREERARAKRAERAAEAEHRPRRPYGQVLLAILLIVGCALGAAVAFTRAGDTTSVVAVTDGVARGETITRDDLTTTRVAGVDGAVPADQLNDLVGRTAVVDLLPGQVVIESASSSDPIPAAGETLVGAALEPSHVPDGLAAGDSVRVLAAPDEGDEPDPNAAELAVAIVYSIDESELVGSGAGASLVTLIVPDGDANAVALYASSDRIVLVETSLAGGGA